MPNLITVRTETYAPYVAELETGNENTETVEQVRSIINWLYFLYLENLLRGRRHHRRSENLFGVRLSNI